MGWERSGQGTGSGKGIPREPQNPSPTGFAGRVSLQSTSGWEQSRKTGRFITGVQCGSKRRQAPA